MPLKDEKSNFHGVRSKQKFQKLFLVQKILYVKQNLRGGWSGFGMVRTWDGSQLIWVNWDESQQIVFVSQTNPNQEV